MKGTIKKIALGRVHGFIVPDDRSPDVFVSQGQLISPIGKNLTEGDRVKFEVHQGERGPRASEVRSID